MEYDKLTPQAKRHVELLIPSDAADYLEPREDAPKYRTPLQVDGVEVDLNQAKAFQRPAAR